MRLLTRSAACALAATILTTVPALAATPTRATAKGPAGAREDVETRIKTLHQQLHITTEQEPAWKTFAQTMRDNATRMKELREKKNDTQSMTAIDQLNAYAAVVDAHADGVHKLISPFQTLYDSMSDEQKKTADRVFRERARKAAERHRQ